LLCFIVVLYLNFYVKSSLRAIKTQ